jgi:N,N'-diacetyllegionaminate synthase
MRIGGLDLEKRTLIVAEIGNNHEGDFAVARQMLKRAAQTGVDAVKFQTFIPEHYVSHTDAARLERLRRFQLSREQFRDLAAEAADLGVIFFSTPFDLESARFLDQIQPVFKIASGDNNFFPLIETVARFAKPLIISTGFADFELLERVRALVAGVWSRHNAEPGLAFLHCVACYPVPPEQANLAAIGALRARFADCLIGYSDHTLGIQAAVYAVAAGARIIEKHFTLDKSYSDFRDHQLSADPDDMRRLVAAVRETEVLLGDQSKAPQPCETASASAVRRSIAAARDLVAGATLGPADITWVRPGSGIPPGEEQRVLGRKTLRALPQGAIIALEDLA